MKKYISLVVLLVVLTLSSCGSVAHSGMTRAKVYPKMYQEHPAVLLVMPPINKTVNVEAKEYLYTSMAKPLAEKGYYVISPFLAMDFLKNESAYDSERFIDGNLMPFKTVFGADALLFTVINDWKRNTVANTIFVDIEYILKSTTDGEILFKRKGELVLDLSSNSNSTLGLLVSMIQTALTDKIKAARMCNDYVIQDLPTGLYSPSFDKDQNAAVESPDFKVTVRQ